MAKYRNINLDTIRHGPQTSEQTTLKEELACLLTVGLPERRRCLAHWQDSQSKLDTSENWGHDCLSKGKDGWHNQQWASSGLRVMEQVIGLDTWASKMQSLPDSYPLPAVFFAIRFWSKQWS